MENKEIKVSEAVDGFKSITDSSDQPQIIQDVMGRFIRFMDAVDEDYRKMWKEIEEACNRDKNEGMEDK
jgi:hypothetical protein